MVWERPDGVTEVIVGAYDRQVHFLDAATGRPTRPPFPTGDLIKGSVTLDPDGFPLLYTGSRDNHYRVIALDRDVPTELFALDPHPQGVWNNDWDGNGVIVDGLLVVGGEDSWFRVVELHRSVDADGLVQVDPVVLAEAPGFDEQLFDDVGDGNVSIESSPLVVGDVAYVVNSGGLVSGFDLSDGPVGRHATGVPLLARRRRRRHARRRRPTGSSTPRSSTNDACPGPARSASSWPWTRPAPTTRGCGASRCRPARPVPRTRTAASGPRPRSTATTCT